MKIKILIAFLFSMMSYFSNAQADISIDILIHANDDNIEYSLKEFIPAFVEKHNGEENCTTYNIIESLDEAVNPYVIELWESKEYLNTTIFREKRKKTKKVQGKEDQVVNYIAAGVKIHSEVEIYGRMIEKESTSVLDLFKVFADVDRELKSDDVKNKWRKGNNSALKESVLAEYDGQIAKVREDIRIDIQNAVMNGVKEMVGRCLLPPSTIDEATKIKKDKAKQVRFSLCSDQKVYDGSSLFYFPVTLRDTMAGFDIYKEVGSAYPTNDEGIYGVRGGEKEILQYLKDEKHLIMGEVESIYHYNETKSKTDKTKDIDFVFQFEPTHNYSPTDVLNFEFMYQAYFLRYRNVRVIAYNPVTQSINKSFRKSIFESDKDTSELKLEIDKNKLTKTLWVKIGNPTKNKFSKDNGIRLFSDKKVTSVEQENIVNVKTSFKMDGEEFSDVQFFGVKNRRVGLMIADNALNLDKIHDKILYPNAKVVRPMLDKKGRVESFLLESVSPVFNKQKYKVYDKENFGEKTKKVGELKVIEVLNQYLVIAEIDSGKSKITKLFDSGTPLYTKRVKSGLMGFYGGSFVNKLDVEYISSSKL